MRKITTVLRKIVYPAFLAFLYIGMYRDEKIDAPGVLVKWVLERVDSFPKNQR